MNLIIEAGGTKSNLVFVNKGETIASYTEPGLQLSRESLEDFEKKIVRWSEFHPLTNAQDEKIQSVFLFAAGIIDYKKEKSLKEIITRIFNTTNIHFHSDLLAACYATAGNRTGIVGILGTGSNSCYYDGHSVVKNISPGGFILGDEGSASDIGKTLLLDYLRLEIPAEIKKQLEDELNLSANLIIQNIYCGTIKEAASFCSSMASFATSRLENSYCNTICTAVIENYLALLAKNYLSYSNQLYLAGSTAFSLKDILKAEAEKKNIEIVKITQYPVNDLALFLSAKHQL